MPDSAMELVAKRLSAPDVANVARCSRAALRHGVLADHLERHREAWLLLESAYAAVGALNCTTRYKSNKGHYKLTNPQLPAACTSLLFWQGRCYDDRVGVVLCRGRGGRLYAAMAAAEHYPASSRSVEVMRGSGLWRDDDVDDLVQHARYMQRLRNDRQHALQLRDFYQRAADGMLASARAQLDAERLATDQLGVPAYFSTGDATTLMEHAREAVDEANRIDKVLGMGKLEYYLRMPYAPALRMSITRLTADDAPLFASWTDVDDDQPVDLAQLTGCIGQGRGLLQFKAWINPASRATMDDALTAVFAVDRVVDGCDEDGALAVLAAGKIDNAVFCLGDLT